MKLFKLFLTLTKEGSKGAGKKGQYRPPTNTFKVTHNDRIRQLKNDEYVSGDYLKGLINTSKNKADLNNIFSYLSHRGKTSNIPKSELTKLKTELADKLEKIELKELLKHLKDNGMLNHIDLDIFF